MEVSAIGPVSNTVRLNPVEVVAELVEANEAARLPISQPANNVTTDAPNITGSATYLPALFVQAAHFQLLAQAGSFAALHPTEVSAPVATDAVTKVSGVEGGTVSTLS